MDRPFVAENRKERQRLNRLAAHLTEDELNITMWDGWTVASALVHLAFWDRYALALIQKWKQAGVSPNSIDDNVTNNALLSLCPAIPARVAMKLAVEAAEEVDLELENAPNEFIEAIAELGDRFRLYRCDHRRLHLDQIERFLQKRTGAK
jgi:hypothetical protein